MNADAAVAELFALCRLQADVDYIGESISQLEHMTQAADLAQADGADDELVLAAFCHDVGHFCVPSAAHNSMAGLGRVGHEQVGAHWLRGLGFPDRLCGVVARHVDAKRYLCRREAGYLAALSSASWQTLAWQGGPMSDGEADAFEQDPLFADSLRLRRWDEQAKEIGRPMPDLAELERMAVQVYLSGRPNAVRSV
jgi:phosphonate degradation associated HDIG domain protein